MSGFVISFFHNKKEFFDNALMFFVLAFLFLFSDFYYVGVGRPFDYLVIFILFARLRFRYDQLTFPIIAKEAFVLLLIVFPWLYAGLFNGSVLGVAAIAVGLCLVFPVFYYVVANGLSLIVENNIKLLVFLSSIILLAQTIIFYLFEVVVDFSGLIGSIESRGYNEKLNYFRPSGLFQEPNSYCAALFSLLVISSYFKKRNKFIEILGIITIIMTQSLWGFGAVFLLVCLLYRARGVCVLLAGLALTYFYITYICGLDISALKDSSVTIDRIVNLSADPSRQARYGSVDNFNFDLFFFIGHGIDTDDFQNLAANGLAFMIYSFGLLGSFFVFAFFVFLCRFDFKVLLATIFLLTTYPLFSYMYFWAWLGIVLAFRAKSVYNKKECVRLCSPKRLKGVN